MTITELIKFDKLKEGNETLKKELAEKEQEINSFKQQIDMAHYFNQNLDSKIKELKQQILFKEDFLIVPDLKNSYRGYISKEKYEKLPSKDVK
ncbi:hypothetical protein [Spiroplasma endosymbiont of Polydrusus cervinus]|uniref:hypothetical protein n=1 Tax=Spiroplasma endosymbiont of Polydrusus cervinus TaxID=3066287 RepID=UPI0030CC72A0